MLGFNLTQIKNSLACDRLYLHRAYLQFSFFIKQNMYTNIHVKFLRKYKKITLDKLWQIVSKSFDYLRPQLMSLVKFLLIFCLIFFMKLLPKQKCLQTFTSPLKQKLFCSITQGIIAHNLKLLSFFGILNSCAKLIKHLAKFCKHKSTLRCL